MGYLCNRGLLEDLRDLWEWLPEGWTMNTPCMLTEWEVGYYMGRDNAENLKDNKVFMQMREHECSAAQVVYGLDYTAPEVEVFQEQRIAALEWVQWLDNRINANYSDHYACMVPHSMWARYFGRPEANHAILINDLSDREEEFKDSFAAFVSELERAYRPDVECTPRSGGSKGNGMSRNIVEASNGWWWSVREKRWARGINHGYRPRGKSLSDKRRAEMRDCKRRSRAVWV